MAKTLAQLKKDLWKVFALYIKQRDNYTCFTCGAKVEGYNCQAGHFIPKAAGGLALYFNEDNVRVQCSKCNLFLEGNHYIYGMNLGEETVKKLYSLMHKNEKWDRADYEEKINHYKALIQ